MLVSTPDIEQKEQYRAALEDDIAKLGYEADQTSRSEMQRMFPGHVHEAYINWKAKPYIKKIKAKTQKQDQDSSNKTDISESTSSTIPIDPFELKKLKAYVLELEKMGVDLTKEYENWLKIGFSIASFGEKGRSFFHRVSEFNADYDKKKCDKMFTSCLKDYHKKKITIGSFYHLCQKAQIKPVIPKADINDDRKPKKRKSVAEKQAEIEQLLSNLPIRHNEVSGRPEILDKGAKDFRPMEDRDFNSIFRHLCNNNIGVQINNLFSLLQSDFIPKFNPFKDYFNNLPKWDGTDYLSILLRTIRTTNDELWKRVAKKWIIAMVASALDNKTINHTVLVLVGRQGCGKTSWLNRLLPKALESYVYNGAINPNNKDTLLMLATSLLINMDELEALNRSEIGALKALITMPDIRLRKAYGRYTEYLPHVASFSASINDPSFLRDHTGNRRWLPFTVKSIDYMHDLDMDKVYSQLFHLYKSGEKYWFSPTEIEEINAHNEQYALQSMEEETLLMKYVPCTKEEADFNATTSQIAEYLFDNKPKFSINPSVINSLGKALRKHGFCRFKKNGNQVYAVKKILEDKKSETNRNTDRFGKEEEKHPAFDGSEHENNNPTVVYEGETDTKPSEDCSEEQDQETINSNIINVADQLDLEEEDADKNKSKPEDGNSSEPDTDQTDDKPKDNKG